MKKPFIYSAIAFVLFLFGCEEEYDKSGIYSVDIVTMNKTDAYAVVDYRTLCGSGRLDTVPPHSKTVNKILIWDTHLVTDWSRSNVLNMFPIKIREYILLPNLH